MKGLSAWPHWGSTGAEIARPMPGDELVPGADHVTTRAVTIHARPPEVWPWLAQMGERPRGGFYSYAWVERLGGMRVQNRRRILPAFQQLRPGDVLDHGGNLVVKAVCPPRYLVLGVAGGRPDFECSWCLALYPRLGGITRLVSRVRARAQFTRGTAALLAVLGPGQLVMERRMLLGIRERVDAAARLAA